MAAALKNWTMRQRAIRRAHAEFQAFGVLVQDSPDSMVGCGPSRYSLN
jgi:hypothetical protein